MNEEKEMMADHSEVRHIIASDTGEHTAKIKIVGVGGAGGNAVNRMVNMNIKNVEFIAINTDALALENNLADEKIAIGQKTTKTLGAGAKPEVGRQALIEDKDTVEKKLEGADMIFISAGMGGGTGTGAAPVVAEIAHKLGILTVAVVTMPFTWEGPVRRRNAESGLATLRKHVDSIIVINNQRILEVIEKNTPMKDALLKVDEVLGNAVRSICDIMFIHGTINADFNDAKTIMLNGGSALMGTGTASGEDRAVKAAAEAIACPLLDNVKVKGASGALINIAHGENFSMMEFSEAMDFLYKQIGDDNEPNIISGDVTIPSLGDKVSITVIATGFDQKLEAEDLEARPVAAKISKPRIEQATPRPTIDFEALAKITPKDPTVQESKAPVTERIAVLRSVPEESLAPAAEAAKPVATSFADSDFDARRGSEVEELQTVSDAMPTRVMEKAEAPAETSEEASYAASESAYGVPSFMKNNHISMQDF